MSSLVLLLKILFKNTSWVSLCFLPSPWMIQVLIRDSNSENKISTASLACSALWENVYPLSEKQLSSWSCSALFSFQQFDFRFLMPIGAPQTPEAVVEAAESRHSPVSCSWVLMGRRGMDVYTAWTMMYEQNLGWESSGEQLASLSGLRRLGSKVIRKSGVRLYLLEMTDELSPWCLNNIAA